MNLNDVRQRMAANAERIRALANGLSPEQARWKPDPDSWSALEVINHLYDEEREDFRVRLDIILHRPGEPWPPIDPGGNVSARRYNERDLSQSLEAYLAERRASLDWLAGLGGANWDAAYETRWGVMRAGDMLASWAAHDLLHLRQLVELQYLYTREVSLQPYAVQYAGDW
jgi:hypothetical protein